MLYIVGQPFTSEKVSYEVSRDDLFYPGTLTNAPKPCRTARVPRRACHSWAPASVDEARSRYFAAIEYALARA